MQYSPIEIIKFMTRNNLQECKPKGSRMAFSSKGGKEKNKSSVIFASESKQKLSEGQSIVITSYETLQDKTDTFTHWTPNTFRYGTYADFKNRKAIGHEKGNLRQVSVIGIDIDTKLIDLYELMANCLNVDLPYPNLIIETEKGYQLSYVLDTPFFIHKQSNYKALRVVERISNNIREVLSKFIPVDKGCNHFGFFRIPRTDNVRYFSTDPVDTQSLINWSRKFDKDEQKKSFHVISSNDELRQVETDWYKALIQCDHIQKGIHNASRNNVMLSLALANYQSEVSLEQAYNVLDEFNSNLNNPLSNQEVGRIIRSAYSGKYRAASRNYVETILEVWGCDVKYQPTKTGWYKFAKPRKERQRSHYYEWENDIIEYLEKATNIESPYLEITERQLSDMLNIPLRSLQQVFKKSSKIFRHVTGKGRGRKTILASRQIMLLNFLQNRKRFIEHTKKTFLTGIKKGIHYKKMAKEISMKIYNTLEYFIQCNQKLNINSPPYKLII